MNGDRCFYPKWTDRCGQDKVYLLWAEGTSFFKIGFTQQPLRKRVSNMQTACPLPIRFLGAGLGTAEDEAFLHRHLARFRTVGEWFDLPEDVLRVLAQVFNCPVFDNQEGVAKP